MIGKNDSYKNKIDLLIKSIDKSTLFVTKAEVEAMPSSKNLDNVFKKLKNNQDNIGVKRV